MDVQTPGGLTPGGVWARLLTILLVLLSSDVSWARKDSIPTAQIPTFSGEPEITRVPKNLGRLLGPALNPKGPPNSKEPLDVVVVPGSGYNAGDALALFWGRKGPPTHIVLLDKRPLLLGRYDDEALKEAWRHAKQDTGRLNPWLFGSSPAAPSAQEGAYLLSDDPGHPLECLGGHILAVLENFGATEIELDVSQMSHPAGQRAKISFSLEKLGVAKKPLSLTFVQADLSLPEGVAAALEAVPAEAEKLGLLVKALFMPGPGILRKEALNRHIVLLGPFYEAISTRVTALLTDTPIPGRHNVGLPGDWKGMRQLNLPRVPFGYGFAHGYTRSTGRRD